MSKILFIIFVLFALKVADCADTPKKAVAHATCWPFVLVLMFILGWLLAS